MTKQFVRDMRDSAGDSHRAVVVRSSRRLVRNLQDLAQFLELNPGYTTRNLSSKAAPSMTSLDEVEEMIREYYRRANKAMRQASDQGDKSLAGPVEDRAPSKLTKEQEDRWAANWREENNF